MTHTTLYGASRTSPAALPRVERRMLRATLRGSGVCLPQRVVTNAELIETYGLDTTSEWIEQKTGIRERRYAAEHQGVFDLAVEAALAALEASHLTPDDLDCLVVASCTSEWRIPSLACLVQGELGASNAAAWDVNAACSGFPFAFDSLLRYLQGREGVGLVIGADCGHRMTDPHDRLTSVFFGDGAGALAISSDGPGRVLSSKLYTCGDAAALRVPADGVMTMDGKAVWNFATQRLPETVLALCQEANVPVQDLRAVIAHQSNRNILTSAARALSLPIDRWPVNLDRCGNTVAASIPLALHEALRTEQYQSGDLLALVGYGGGLAWGGQLWRL